MTVVMEEALAGYSEQARNWLSRGADIKAGNLVVDKYVITGELGRGGMGLVFSARCPTRGEVALKALDAPPPATMPEEQRKKRQETLTKRFLREVKALESVYDPHLVPIFGAYGVRKLPDLLYLVMPKLSGCTAKQVIGDNSETSVRRLIDISSDVVSALCALHKARIVHRDVTPSNIWLLQDSPRALLLDCGLAKFANDSTNVSGGIGNGTKGYAAPDQLFPKDGSIGPWTDLFSLGCTIYTLWTGIPPFASEDWQEYLEDLSSNVIPKSPADVCKDTSSLGVTFSNMVMRWLDKDWEARRRDFPSADVVRSDLRNLLQYSAVEAPVATAASVTPVPYAPILDRKLDALQGLPDQLNEILLRLRGPSEQAVQEAFADARFVSDTPAGKIRVLKAPEINGRYEDLYSGFDAGEYVAYHAPFRVETSVWDRAISVHADRLGKIDRAKYIFADEDAYDRARGFFHDVRSKTKAPVNQKITLIHCATEASSAVPICGCSYFVGYRGSVPRCILYLSQPQGRQPKAAVVVDGNAGLASILRDHFVQQWSSMRSEQMGVKQWPPI